VPAARIIAGTGLAAVLLCAQACAPVPTAPPADAGTAPPVAQQGVTGESASQQVPELTLHLPTTDQCAACPSATRDRSFLDRGYQALLDGEYIEAVQYFQRYQRLESSPRAQWEAAIAIAYVSLLPRSPYYDPEAARDSFQGLRRQSPKDMGAEDYTRLMRQALLNMLALEREIEELKSRNANLQETLDKREEALKRLRELTLGQKGSSP